MRAPLFLLLYVATVLLDDAFAAGRAAAMVFGAILVALTWAERNERPPEGRPPRAVLIAPAMLAGLALLSLLWSVDPAATAGRARHLALEAALVPAVIWLGPRRTLAWAGLLGACVLLGGFGAELMSPHGVRLRAFGVHPNLQGREAALAGLLLALAVPIPRGVVVLGGLSAGLALGLSFSSGALLAAVGAAAVLALAPSRRLLAAMLLAGTLAGGLLLSASAPERVRSPATALRGDAVEEIGSGRLVIWGHATRVIAQHPLLGCGAGAFPAAMEPIRVAHQARGGEHSKPRRRAHSVYLELLAELGPVGLLLFVGPLLLGVREAWRRRDPVAGALLAFVLLSAATDSLLQTKSLWLGWAVALSATWPGTRPPSPPPTT